MPIYEYACSSCGHELEAIQKISDSPLISCPACSADQLQKKVSAPSFRLSGNGWYETDFKTGKQKNVAKKEQEKPPASGCCSGGSCAAH